MGSPSNSVGLFGLASYAVAIPLVLGHCSGDRVGIGVLADAQAGGNGGRAVIGEGNSPSPDGNAGSGANGGDGASGTSGSGAHGGSGSPIDGGGSKADGGGGNGGPNAGTLCTSPGNPPGCVQCLSDNDCPTAASHCLSGTCVTCVSSKDCGSGSTPVCWPGDHTCHAACGDAGAACPTGPGQPTLCDPSTGACVGCLTPNDCPTTAAICDSSKTCVQCQTDSNCGGTTPHCDPTTQTCVACSTNADCTDPSTPICRFAPPAGRGMPPSLACQPGCTANSQCADAAASVCDSNGYCVQCVDNSTCSGATPVCNANRPYPFPSPFYETCVVCLPPPFGSDAGSQGCDGGTCVPVGRGPGAGYMCQ